MMRWLKDKKREKRSNSASYDDEGKEDDYGFEKERARAASKSPSTRRQLPPTPAMPEEKSPHIYEEIPDMACTAPPAPQAGTESHRKKVTPFGKKANFGGKESAAKHASGGLKGASGNKYTCDLSSPLLSGGGSKAKKSKMDDSDSTGQYVGPSVADGRSRQTPPNLHRNGTPEVHCDVIIKDTHCEILLSRKPKSGGGGSRSDSSSAIPHSNTRTSSTGDSYPLPRGLDSTSWSHQPDMYVGPQTGRVSGQFCSRDRRASMDVHSSSKFTSAFSLASSSSSTAPVIGGASSAGTHTSGAASFSSSTSRLNSLGASSSFSVLNFTEPYQPKPTTSSSAHQHKQIKQQHQSHHLYQEMQAPQVPEENNGPGESAGSTTSSAKGVETYTTASNFIARPTIVPFNPLPGAKDPCVEAFGRRLSTGSSSTDAAYASIRDDAVDDSAYQTAPLQTCSPKAGTNALVTYASIQDTEGNDINLVGPSARSHVTYASIQDEQHLQQRPRNNLDGSKQHQKLFYGDQHHQIHNSTNTFQQSKSFESLGFFHGSMPAGIIHRRSPSDSSSCTYASVSFPTEPKHYNTINDVSNSQRSSEDFRRSNATSYKGVALGSKPQQTYGTADAGDGIYSGVEPYRVNSNGFDQRAISGGTEFSKHRSGFGARAKNPAPHLQQSLYSDISPEQGGGGNPSLYTCIDPINTENNFRNMAGAVCSGKPFSHSSDNASHPNTLFNDLHRYAVDRNSFQLDFCTCSDDHASSCGFSDLIPAKQSNHYDSVDGKTFSGEHNSNALTAGASSRAPNNADSNRTEYASSSCKDCGRLIKQITYSESYSDETYEHAYSSRLLTRKNRRYSSPDITFSEISNSEFNQDPPSYLHFRSSPSWSRRSPGHDARISRDDSWAPSPRSDDVIPPAYGALDDNGFVSNHYERYSPTYARNRDTDKTVCSQLDSVMSRQRKNRPWIPASTFPEGLLGQNMADDMKTQLCRAGKAEEGSAFFTPSSFDGDNAKPMYSEEKENHEPRSNYLVKKGLKESSETNKRMDIRPGWQGKEEKSQAHVSSEAAERDVDKYSLSKSGNAVDETETRDQIPDKNTKKLATYFQSLTTSKEALVGSEDNILMAQVDDKLVSKTPKQLGAHFKPSAFTKLPTHSASFCAPKIADSKKTKHSLLNEDSNLGSQSSPDVSKSRNQCIAAKKLSATPLAPNTIIGAAVVERQNIASSGSEKYVEGNSRLNDACSNVDMIKNTESDNGRNQKPQNKTDSGDTCYEFDISTSSEGEQQSSYDNILSKVRISLNLEHEVQHIADSRAARRKKLLCRRCKKLGLASSNVYSVIDGAAQATEAKGATGTSDRREGILEDDLAFMMEDDEMCPHLSLKFGELRAMLDNMFVDQRAAILDCLTDQAASPNPYAFKSGSHGLHLCAQELGSLPAALQQLCRECGSEVMTSDSESITTVYSGSLQLQASQPGTQMRISSPGSGPPHTPSCDSDEGTMADNSGDDDDDLSDQELSKTNLLKNGSPLSCCHAEGKQVSRKNSSPSDFTKSHKHSCYKVSARGSSNSASTHNMNCNNNHNSNNKSKTEDNEGNNSSGYDEPEDHLLRYEHSAPRHERSQHRVRKKEKRERKSTSHSHGLSCTCVSESRSTRKTPSHSATRSSHHSSSCADISKQGFPAQKISKSSQNCGSGAQYRKSGSKKPAACSSPYCAKHGANRHNNSHAAHHLDQSRASRSNSVDPTEYDEEEVEVTCSQQGTNGSSSSRSNVTSSCSSVSEKALKDIYSPLPAKALCLLTSRHNNSNNNNNNNNNNNISSSHDNEGIININNNSIISSNSSSSSSNTSSSSLAVHNISCTCGKTLAFEEGQEHTVYTSSSVAPLFLPAGHKEKQTSAETEARTKERGGQSSSTSRETESGKAAYTIKTSSNEMASGGTGDNANNDDNNSSLGGGRQEEEISEAGDNRDEVGHRVALVQTHLVLDKEENKAQSCVNAPSEIYGRGCCSCGSCLPCCDSWPVSFEVQEDKCAQLGSGREVPCCAAGRDCHCRGRMSQQHKYDHVPPRHQQQHQLHYGHHPSGKHFSLCNGNYSAQPITSWPESNSLVFETPDMIYAPYLLSKTKSLACTVSPVSVTKDSTAGFPLRNKVKQGGGIEVKEISKTKSIDGEFENNTMISSSKPPNGRSKLEEGEVSIKERKTCKKLGKFENKTDEMTQVGDCGKGARTPAGTASFLKPPTTGTAAELTINSSPQETIGSRCEQRENPCSNDEPPKYSRDCDRNLSEYSLSADMQMKSSGSAASSLPDSAGSAPCSSSSAARTKLGIPKKHIKHIKLELATLDLLPETALGGDMTELDTDLSGSSAQLAATVTVDPTASVPHKSRPRERGAVSNVVQKMAKMFEENANNKPNGKYKDENNKKSQNPSSPQVQRSTGGKAISTARASATSAGKPDVKSEKGVIPATEAPGEVAPLLPAALPPSQRVAPGQRSPDVLAHQNAGETDRPRATIMNQEPSVLLSCTVPQARSRSKPAQDFPVSEDCSAEKRLRRPGVNGAREQSVDEKPNTSEDCLDLAQGLKDDCPSTGSQRYRHGAKSEDQVSENASKEMHLRAGVWRSKASEESEEEEKMLGGEKNSDSGKFRSSKPRGSKLKHSDLLQRLKNAKDSRSREELQQNCPGDSSSASSSPSSTKKATANSSVAGYAEGDSQAVASVHTTSTSNQHQPGKQKRYSKKPYHKRRSKSRTSRRRSGSRAGLDKEERTYYYFSSDLSDIDVVEVDDWETYASSMSVKKTSQHTGRTNAGKLRKEKGAESANAGQDTPTGGLENSPLRTRKQSDSSSTGNAKTKSRASLDAGSTVSGRGNSSRPSLTSGLEETQTKDDVEDEDVKIYSCISPTATTTAAAAAVGSASASSSPMASPELPKPRRNRRSACVDGSGKTNQLEVYKTKRSSNANKLLSELIVRNYDMQIYGNV